MPTPNDLLSNTQGQANTTSDNGSNRVAKLNAKSHFFLEDGTFTQIQAQAFGVVSDDEFCTTARVSVSGKKVVAVCAGQIFVQPQSGPSADASKVNLILKPYKQPINGLAIKYFVYRGLPKADFFETNGNVKASGSGLITYIRNEFSSFYNNNSEPIPAFLGSFIGYPGTGSTQQETDFIDNYFYKISQSFDNETGPVTDPKLAFEFPMIPAGTHLATVSGEVGFDIVLSEGDYFLENDPNPFKLDLKFARAAKHTLNAAAVSDAYQRKVLREACTRFIDPAAYFGIHANGGNIYRFGQTSAINTPANIAALITNFYTKNNIYIYIQSNRQRSYNFYGTQKISDTNLNNIKIGIAENTLTETTFETNKWPVKVFNTAPAGGSTQQTIVLQLTTDRGGKTALFGRLANIKSSNQEGFVDATDLVDPTPANYLTKSVILSSPINTGQNIASFAQVVYMGKDIVLSKPGIDDGNPSTPSPPPVLFTINYMDDVFYLTKATSFLIGDGIFHVHSNIPTLYSQKDIDKRRNNAVAYTQKTQDTIQISSSLQLTLFTYLSVVAHEQSSHSNILPNTSPNKEATGYSAQNVTEQYTLPNLPPNEFIVISEFTDTADIIKNITLKGYSSLATTLVLGITAAEQNRIKTAINNHYNAKIYFDPVFEIDKKLISAEGIQYKKFKLGVLTDVSDFSNEIVFPTEDVIIYSTDGLLFYSKEYGQHVTEVIQEYSDDELTLKM